MMKRQLSMARGALRAQRLPGHGTDAFIIP
jgi:hypothetical protein